LNRRSDFFLAAVFVLSLLLMPGANYWDNYQKRLSDQQLIVEHEEESAALAQQFNANCTTAIQMQHGILQAQNQLGNVADPFEQNGGLIKNALLNNLPQGWLSEDAVVYVFKFSPNNSKALTGEGLARQNSAFMAKIIYQLRDWQNINVVEQNKINNRLASIFGERVNGEMLLSNRNGRSIDVVFNGKSRIIFWDFLRVSGKQIGAFLIISSTKPSPKDTAEKALDEIAKASQNRFFPILMPLKSLRSELNPLIPGEYRGETTVLQFFSLLTKNTEYSQIASLSSGILYEHVFTFRAVLPRHLPYELWLTAELPEQNRIRISSIYGWLLALFWLTTFGIRLWRSQPFNFSVKARLLGLVIIVGGFPILLLILAGRSVIEQDHYVRERSLIDEVRSEMREIDGNSTALRMIFENIARRYLSNKEFKSAMAVAKVDKNSEILRHCFAEFAANGVPLNAIGIVYFGNTDQMIFSPDSNKKGDQSKLNFFSPMMYAGLKDLSESDHNKAMEKLSESKRLGFETYHTITNTPIFGDLSLARQKSLLMSFGDTEDFIVYDFIADNGKIVAAVIFFAPASEAYARFARNAIMRGAKSSPDRLWAMAEKREANIGLVVPRSRVVKEHENWFLQTLSEALRTSSFQVETLEKTLAICTPCENMQGIALGSTVSLEPLFTRTSQQYHLLLTAALLLSAILAMVTSALASFFLRPLHVIETGIINILERKFDFRLNMNRDDELGDVADAFDSMAQGLYERNELAQFVSGTLSRRLDVTDQLEKKPEKRWGVVLASDIRNFTTLSETYPPEQIVELLNRHLELMSTQITSNHGEIDKFIGDAIIAVFFGDSKTSACKNAVEAAIGMMTQHGHFVEKRNEQGLFGYGMGIGVACGELLIGSFGAGERHEYSLTGKARQQSEELEAESKQGHYTHIVVSPEIKNLMPDLSLTPLTNSENFEVLEA